MPGDTIDWLSGQTAAGRDPRLLHNQRDTALLAGITARALQDWDVQPCAYRGREALYDWREVRDELLRRRAPPKEEGELDLDAERARLASEQADKIAMENAITRGEVAYLPDIADEQARVFEMIRAKLLALPAKAAPLANPDNPNLARDVVERDVLELLAEIASAELDAEPDESAIDVPPVAADDPGHAGGNGTGEQAATTKPRKQRRARRNGGDEP